MFMESVQLQESEPFLPCSIPAILTNEYDPMHPNDYESVLKERRQHDEAQREKRRQERGRELEKKREREREREEGKSRSGRDSR